MEDFLQTLQLSPVFSQAQVFFLPFFIGGEEVFQAVVFHEEPVKVFLFFIQLFQIIFKKDLILLFFFHGLLNTKGLLPVFLPLPDLEDPSLDPLDIFLPDLDQFFNLSQFSPVLFL